MKIHCKYCAFLEMRMRNFVRTIAALLSALHIWKLGGMWSGFLSLILDTIYRHKINKQRSSLM